MGNPPRGRWPAGLLGMLVLVLAAERYVVRHAWKFIPAYASAWERAGAGVPGADRSAVVAFGDSLVKNGVVPRVVEARAGRSASNLAVPGGVFPAHHALFRRLLRTGARPEAVVVDGELMGYNPFKTSRSWVELATAADSLELARAGGDPSFFGWALAAGVLPSYRARDEVRAGVTAALNGRTPDTMFQIPVAWRNWRVNGGAELMPPHDPALGDTCRETLVRTNYSPGDWACDPVNAAYATRFLDLAEAHGVAVFWLLPPYHPEVQDRRERSGWYPQYVAYLRRLQARYPHLTVVDGRRAGYPPEALGDMTHLNRVGAVAYSDALGRVLRDTLSLNPRRVPRWVDLPRYDGPAAEALASASGVEDIDQSNQAIKRRLAGREERRVGLGEGAGVSRR